MTMLTPSVPERVDTCLNRLSRLTMGEIELLRALRDRGNTALSMLEERELQQIEQKLGVSN